MKKIVDAFTLLLKEEKKHSIKKWINNIQQKEKEKHYIQKELNNERKRE